MCASPDLELALTDAGRVIVSILEALFEDGNPANRHDQHTAYDPDEEQDLDDFRGQNHQRVQHNGSPPSASSAPHQ